MLVPGFLTDTRPCDVAEMLVVRQSVHCPSGVEKSLDTARKVRALRHQNILEKCRLVHREGGRPRKTMVYPTKVN